MGLLFIYMYYVYFLYTHSLSFIFMLSLSLSVCLFLSTPPQPKPSPTDTAGLLHLYAPLVPRGHPLTFWPSTHPRLSWQKTEFSPPPEVFGTFPRPSDDYRSARSYFEVAGDYRFAPGPAEEVLLFSLPFPIPCSLIPPFGSRELKCFLSPLEGKRKEQDPYEMYQLVDWEIETVPAVHGGSKSGKTQLRSQWPQMALKGPWPSQRCSAWLTVGSELRVWHLPELGSGKPVWWGEVGLQHSLSLTCPLFLPILRSPLLDSQCFLPVPSLTQPSHNKIYPSLSHFSRTLGVSNHLCTKVRNSGSWLKAEFSKAVVRVSIDCIWGGKEKNCDLWSSIYWKP